MKTATIKLFLINGDPNRLRTAEISNWTGKAISGPRSDMEDILKRPESEQTGVYFLYGVDPETGDQAVYIGEAAVVKPSCPREHRRPMRRLPNSLKSGAKSMKIIGRGSWEGRTTTGTRRSSRK